MESVNRSLVNPLLGWSQGHYLIYEQNGERRVSTVNDRPVTDVLSTQSVPVALRRPVSVIDGDTAPATGVVASSQTLMQTRLTTESFNAKIRALLITDKRARRADCRAGHRERINWAVAARFLKDPNSQQKLAAPVRLR